MMMMIFEPVSAPDDSLDGITQWMDELSMEHVNWGSLVERTNVYTDTPPSVDQLTASIQRRAVRKRMADVAVNVLMQRVVETRGEGASAALQLSVRIATDYEENEEADKEN